MLKRRMVLTLTAAVFGAAWACADLSGLAEGTSDAGTEADAVGPGDAAADASACPVGYRDCDGDPQNGCETNVFESPSHCGFCSNVCPQRANGFGVCVDGKCRIGCNSDFGDCNSVDTDGCETPVSSDTTNCGACTHDCKDPSTGACAAGLCSPAPVASDLAGTLVALGVTTNTLVYQANDATSSTGQRIFRVAVGGGAPTALAEVTTGQNGVRRLVVEGTWAVWLDELGLGWRSLTSTASGSRIAEDLSPDDPLRFWLIFNEVDSASLVAVNRAEMFADAAAAPAVRIPYSNYAGPAIAADKDAVHFASFPAGAILSLPLTPAADVQPSLILNDAGTPRGMTARADRLLWVSSTGDLLGCIRATCVPRAFGKTKWGTSFAADDTFVYWTDQSGLALEGKVLRCPVTGCIGAPTALAKAQNRPRGLALFGDHVYWTVSDTSGTKSHVYRVAR